MIGKLEFEKAKEPPPGVRLTRTLSHRRYSSRTRTDKCRM
jgi:hypothetical protein